MYEDSRLFLPWFSLRPAAAPLSPLLLLLFFYFIRVKAGTVNRHGGNAFYSIKSLFSPVSAWLSAIIRNWKYYFDESGLFRFFSLYYYSFFFYFLSNPGRENGIAVILDSLNVNPDYESRGGQHTGGAWEWNNKKRRKANMEISRKLQFPSGSSLVQFLLVSIVHLI